MRAFLAAFLLCLFAGSAAAEEGVASVYWEGTRTANGERLCRSCLTAAMWTLDGRPVPFGTLVKVCRVHADYCVVVRINDRGPAKRLHRLIDLTPAAARALGFSGLTHVNVELLGYVPRHGAFGRF